MPSANNIRYQSKNVVRGIGKNTQLTLVTDSTLTEYVAKRRKA